jgi:hypothetical protein
MRTTAAWSRFPAPAAQSILGGQAPQPCGLPLTRLAALTGPPAQETTLSIGCKGKCGPTIAYANDSTQPSQPCRAGGRATVGEFPVTLRGRPKIDART